MTDTLSTIQTGQDTTSSDESADNLWASWNAKPDQFKLRKLVNQFNPAIDKTIGSYGAAGGETVKGKARLLVARAIKTFKPAGGAKLSTHVYNSLKSLQRAVPMLTDPMPMPERVRYAHTAIRNAEMNYTDTVGRAPTEEELAEIVHMSPDKIRRIRSAVRGKMPFSVVEERDDDEGDNDIVGSTRTDEDNWKDAVYHDLGEYDRFIMQHRSGYGNADILDNNEIATRLGVSPAHVSQRASLIQRRLDSIHGK